MIILISIIINQICKRILNGGHHIKEGIGVVQKKNMKSFSDFTFDIYIVCHQFFLHLLGTCIKIDDTLLFRIYNIIRISYFSHKIFFISFFDNKISKMIF